VGDGGRGVSILLQEQCESSQSWPSSFRKAKVGFLGVLLPHRSTGGLQRRHGCTSVEGEQRAGEKGQWLDLVPWGLQDKRVSTFIIAHDARYNHVQQHTPDTMQERTTHLIHTSVSFAPHAKLLYQPLEICELVRLGHEAFHSRRRRSRNRLFGDIGTDGQHGGHRE